MSHAASCASPPPPFGALAAGAPAPATAVVLFRGALLRAARITSAAHALVLFASRRRVAAFDPASAAFSAPASPTPPFAFESVSPFLRASFAALSAFDLASFGAVQAGTVAPTFFAVSGARFPAAASQAPPLFV